MMKIPKRGLILEYHSFFGEQPPENTQELISKTTKLELLAILCHISMRLSPRLSSRVDYTIKTQHEIIDYIFRLHPKSLRDQLKGKIHGNSIVFNRPSNLWAMTDIMNSDIPTDQEDSKISSEDLENFFKYYLAVNSETNKIKEFDLDEGTKAENINASIIAHNEYFESVDPLFTLYRGSLLFQHLGNSEDYGEAFRNYIDEKTGFTLQRYLLEIASMYFSNHSEDDKFRFFFRLNEPLKIFDAFSERNYPINERHQLEALHIRKSPFYHVKDNDYLLLDDAFLLEKCYNLIIWDFLFEKLLSGVSGDRERVAIIKRYKSFIGYFFESYIKDRILKGVPYMQHPIPKLFDDLKIGGIELGDVYIRENKKIMFGEVKSSNIPSRSKYGVNLSDLYGDRDEFFKIHGLTQLINNLKVLCSNPEKFEEHLTFRKRHHIFPVIITNELTLTLGMFIQIFNDRFDSQFDRSEFPNLLIKPLMILHVSDLEFLEGYLKDKKLRLFNLLGNHYRKYVVMTKLSMSYDHLQPIHNQYQRDQISQMIKDGQEKTDS